MVCLPDFKQAYWNFIHIKKTLTHKKNPITHKIILQSLVQNLVLSHIICTNQVKL